MRILRRLTIRVSEPFSGGKLILKEGEIQIAPAIYLHPLVEPDYTGVSRELANWHRAHRQKDSYYYVTDELRLFIEGELSWIIEGTPLESVVVEPSWAF